MNHALAVTDFAVTTNFNADLYELIVAVRKFEQTHKPTPADDLTPKPVGVATDNNEEMK